MSNGELAMNYPLLIINYQLKDIPGGEINEYIYFINNSIYY